VKVAVIGAGIVTPLGMGVDATFDALLAGRGAVGPIHRFDASSYPVRFAAEGPDPDGAGACAVALGRSWLDRCVVEALRGVDLGAVPPERVGVFVGAEAARPALDEVAAALLEGRLAGPDRAAALAPSAVTRWLADRVGARGPTATLSTACTSSAQAVGEAALAVRRGEVDVAIAAGVDVLVHPLMVTGFARLGALSTRNDDPASASRPFDLDRDGFVLGEGAGVLVLAAGACADRVGATVGWVLGYGGSSNAWRITDSPPDGRGAAASIRAALRDAGVGPDSVALVQAHGTGTRQNDESEAVGIRAALGARTDEVPVYSAKGALGHLVAACGVVEAALALQAVRRRVAPATRNLWRPDPACPVRHVIDQPLGLGPGVALTNAFGFGGANATLVLGAP